MASTNSTGLAIADSRLERVDGIASYALAGTISR
jgi:hypothetical protein